MAASYRTPNNDVQNPLVPRYLESCRRYIRISNRKIDLHKIIPIPLVKFANGHGPLRKKSYSADVFMNQSRPLTPTMLSSGLGSTERRAAAHKSGSSVCGLENMSNIASTSVVPLDQNFLDVKIEGAPRRLDRRYHPVATYLRDFRSVSGLMIPYVNETAVEGVRQTEKIIVEKAVANPRLEDARFSKPQ
jgi:hypothetical protein